MSIHNFVVSYTTQSFPECPAARALSRTDIGAVPALCQKHLQHCSSPSSLLSLCSPIFQLWWRFHGRLRERARRNLDIVEHCLTDQRSNISNNTNYSANKYILRHKLNCETPFSEFQWCWCCHAAKAHKISFHRTYSTVHFIS